MHVGEHDFLDFDDSRVEDTNQVQYRRLPEKLKLVVDLPTIKSAEQVDLDVEDENVVLEVADLFYLDLELPYKVHSDRGTAKFDKGLKIPQLTLTLPVQKTKENMELQKVEIGRQDDAIKVVKEDGELDSNPDSDLEDLEEKLEKEEQAALKKQQEEEERIAKEKKEMEDLEAMVDKDLAAASTTSLEENEEKKEEVPMLSHPDDYIPSAGFTGSKPGYYFGTGAQGVGYHRDYCGGVSSKKDAFDVKLKREEEKKAPVDMHRSSLIEDLGDRDMDDDEDNIGFDKRSVISAQSTLYQSTEAELNLEYDSAFY